MSYPEGTFQNRLNKSEKMDESFFDHVTRVNFENSPSEVSGSVCSDVLVLVITVLIKKINDLQKVK